MHGASAFLNTSVWVRVGACGCVRGYVILVCMCESCFCMHEHVNLKKKQKTKKVF